MNAMTWTSGAGGRTPSWINASESRSAGRVADATEPFDAALARLRARVVATGIPLLDDAAIAQRLDEMRGGDRG